MRPLYFRAVARASGYIWTVLVQRLDEVLARTDPFDLAQAIERHAATLSDAQIRAAIAGALPRLSEYYREVFAPIAHFEDGSLRAPFVRALKSNLRVLRFFGASFCARVLENVPADRTVAFGEERRSRPRLTAAVVVLAMFALAAVAGGRYVRNARATVYPALSRTSVAAKTVVVSNARSVERPRSVPQESPRPQPEAPPARVAAAPPPEPAYTRARPQRQPGRNARRVPPAAAVVVVSVTPRVQATSDPANQSDLADVSSMPDAYSDATPLPDATMQPVQAPAHVHAATPAPSRKRGNWLHRTILHFDPFKPHP